MDATSPARLYATLVGAVLVVAGILGFFYEASFATGDSIVADDVFGLLAVNGWHNVVHILFGLLGLALAGNNESARFYCLFSGVVYLVLTIWGFAVVDNGIGDLIGLVPVNNEDNVLHLILSLTGFAAAFATRSTTPRSEAPAT
jgi:hypothetical protein